MSVEIKEVTSKSELIKFIKFNLDLYKDNPFVAPPLIADELVTLSRKKNPAFDFCETAYFLAYRNSKIVGRIAAIINHSANEFNKVKHGRFGWVDFIDDKEVSSTLFATAEKWLKEKGMEAVVGPLGLTDMDYEGLLIEGFDKLSTMATIYNFPYYISHIEALGYTKEVDWKEFLIAIPEVLPVKFVRIANLIREKYNLDVKRFKNKKELVKKYGQKIFDLWNICYADLYGTSPLTQKQIDHYINLYLGFVSLDTLSIITDSEDNVMAFGISIPSLTKALQKAKGKLFPFGFIHLLRALKKNDTIDLLIIGVHPEYQNKGITSLIFADMFEKYAKNGIKYAESNPELENNLKISNQWGPFERINHKSRRAYIKHLV
jgi:GNAT superfamily N-acetyltransferase